MKLRLINFQNNKESPLSQQHTITIILFYFIKMLDMLVEEIVNLHNYDTTFSAKIKAP